MFSDIPQFMIVTLTLLIVLWLFNIQKRGTENVSKIFGPIMVTWFSTLAIFGLISIIQTTDVIQAINPINGIMFLKSQGLASFFILSQVLLCITGAEALYADYVKAEEVKDRAALSFLDWYIKEQVEEEDNVGNIVATLKFTDGDRKALLELDRELGQREFKKPFIDN